MSDPSLIAPFIRRLQRLGLMVTGSTAGILYGEPRMTHDGETSIDRAELEAWIDRLDLRAVWAEVAP